jgi:hypothetical protein
LPPSRTSGKAERTLVCHFVREATARQKSEIEVFFTASGALEGNDVRLEGWDEAAAAEQQVDRAGAAPQRVAAFSGHWL